MPKYFVYIAKCADKTLYTGYTNDLKHRERTHNLGKGAKYTRARLPVKIVYSELFKTKGRAMSRESEIKSWKRLKKLRLIQNKLKKVSDLLFVRKAKFWLI